MSRSQSLSTGGKTPENRDLTNILDFGRKLEEKGLFPKLGDENSEKGAVLAEPDRIKIDEFQDLDAIGLMDHPEPAFPAPEVPEAGTQQIQSLTPEPEVVFAVDPHTPHETAPEHLLPTSETFDSAAEGGNFPVNSTEESFPSLLISSPAEPPAPLAFHTPEEVPEAAAPIDPAVSHSFQAAHEPIAQVPIPESIESSPPLIPDFTLRNEPPSPIHTGRSEHGADSTLKTLHEPVIQPGKQTVRTESPHLTRPPEGERQATAETLLFHLQISGALSGTERNRITDFLRKESSLGIRPEDIKLQLETGNVLLPRLSEYVVTLLVQLLRSSHAEIRVIPADAPLPEPAMPEGHLALSLDENPTDTTVFNDRLPVLPAGSPAPQADEDLGLLSATALIPIDGISSRMSGPSASEDYPQALERLEREIQSRARVKNADKITDFKISWEAITPEEANVLSSVAAARRFRHGAWKVTATGHARRGRR